VIYRVGVVSRNDRKLQREVAASRAPSVEWAALADVGFPVPYRSWLKNELRGFAAEVLLDRRTLARGYFQRRAIESLLENGDKRQDCAPEIFSLITFEFWHRQFADLSGHAA